MSRIDQLSTLRDDLKERMVEASDRDFTAMGRLLRDVLADLDDLAESKPEQKGTALDELRARRTARQPGAARQA